MLTQSTQPDYNPGTLYGPYDNSDHLIPSVIRQAMNKKGSILMSGTGDSVVILFISMTSLILC